MTTRSNGFVPAIAACAVLLAVPASAVDGEILIGQGRVNAGGITPGDAPGFPVTLSRPGRYKLTGNLRVPAFTNGIDVTRPSVTIDLNGFTISSNPPGQAERGVFVANGDGLRVSNGTITGFQSSGIDAGAGRSVVVENMRIVSNEQGMSAGSDARIRNNTIANNSHRAIGCSSCLVEQNVVTGNGSEVGGAGGAVHVADGAVVIGNVIAGNQGIGLWSTDGPHEFSGYGNNILFGNNSGDEQIGGKLIQMHPNLCDPACF